jgi:Fic family protein
MPLHRLYFHDIATPDKISLKMRHLIQWMNSAETRRSMHTVRLAAKAHHGFLQIYPFKKHSGKVARLLMNLILLRAGYPPAVIHATERQRYYEALKTSADAVASLTTEALTASVESTIHYFEEQATTATALRAAQLD